MFAMVTFLNSSTYAATLGQNLYAPEEGWKRYDDSNELIKYEGEWLKYSNGENLSNGYAHATESLDASVSFAFKGTQVRILSDNFTNKSKKIAITIDGTTEYFSENSMTYGQTLVYEKNGLSNNIHNVVIKLDQADGYLSLDGIDINEDGYLVDGQPTPKPEEPQGNRAILVVTMTTGLEKEFDLSMKEVIDFIDWYEAKQAGSGRASYAIDKHDNNKGPFKSRKDYILFDRVLTFEVSEY
ncbi:bacterial surface protein [Paenibacillus barcinonensis]|nr:bacterial surface protein [Paenibacillus barcinonensis]